MAASQFSRREFLKLGGGLVIASALPASVKAALPDQPRELALNNLNTGESLQTCYFDGLDYVDSELALLDNFCRDFRRNEPHPMDRRLFDQISRIQTMIGTKSEVLIISGYRSPITNHTLRNRSTGVAKKSYHMLGKAIDFRLDGVSLTTVREAALSLQAGGVGYYPRSNFIHIDTGPIRTW